MIKFIAKALIIAILFGSVFYIVCPKYYFRPQGHYVVVYNKITGGHTIFNLRKELKRGY